MNFISKNREIIKLIRKEIGFGAESFEHFSTDSQKEAKLLLMRELGNDVDSAITYTGTDELSRYIKNSIEENYSWNHQRIGAAILESINNYVAEAVDDILFDLKEEIEVENNVEHGLIAHEDRINGEITWIKAS